MMNELERIRTEFYQQLENFASSEYHSSCDNDHGYTEACMLVNAGEEYITELEYIQSAITDSEDLQKELDFVELISHGADSLVTEIDELLLATKRDLERKTEDAGKWKRRIE